MAQYNLAQLNIAKMKYDLVSPEMWEFLGNLEKINTVAEKASGYVWRLMSDIDSTISAHLFGAKTIVNMSLWTDIESLHKYVYHSQHADIMSRRKEWFEKNNKVYSVLWWLPCEQKPTLLDAHKKYLALKENGPTADAFTFKTAFPKPVG